MAERSTGPWAVCLGESMAVLLPDRVWAAASDHRPVWVDLEVG